MESRSQREHKAIMAFATSRVFPAMDEYQVSHGLETCVDSAVLALLSARMVMKGYSPQDITNLVNTVTGHTLAEVAKTKEQQPSGSNVKPETKTEPKPVSGITSGSDANSNVVSFVSRKPI